MTSDRDLYRTACLLTEQRGGTAATHTTMRADAKPNEGELDGFAVWN